MQFAPKFFHSFVSFLDHPMRQRGGRGGCDFCGVGAVTNQCEIIASLDRELHILVTSVTLGDGAHVEIIGEDEMAVETELITEKPPDDPRR